MSRSRLSLPVKFPELLGEIKARIQQAQCRAVLSVNAELVRLYWDIGRIIDQKQRAEGWGTAVIPRLARELHNELPEEKGFSERNLKYMIRFYREYVTVPIVQQPAAQLGSTNLAKKVLRCFVVIDLKKGAFKPEYAGKMNFYLSVVDDKLRHAADATSIGLILCQDRNHIVAEYALRGTTQPIGISEYELTRALPVTLQSALPTIPQIEAELERTTPKKNKASTKSSATAGRQRQRK